jgi:Ca2+-binding RTX toxin-like protein
MALVPVVLVAGALAGCTPTPGGTASVTHNDFAYGLRFDAVTGRANGITVSVGTQGPYGYPTALVLTDSRNPVTPGSGCTRVNDNTVRCEVTPGSFVFQRIQLGDGNDSFTSPVASPLIALVDAGAGADTVSGGTGDDDFSGGVGNDTLLGRAGYDELNGGTETDYCDVGSGGGYTVNCETGP